MLLRSEPMERVSAPVPAVLGGSASSSDSITDGVKLNSSEPPSGSATDSVAAALTHRRTGVIGQTGTAARRQTHTRCDRSDRQSR